MNPRVLPSETQGPVNGGADAARIVTILRTTGQAAFATKRWRWNSTTTQWDRVSSYTAGAWFTAREISVASLRDLADAIDGVRRDPHAFIVRGVLSESARDAIARAPQQRILRRKRLKQDIVLTLVESWLP